MKRYSSNLNEYKHGKYVLYKDHLKEIEALKKEIRKLKRTPKKTSYYDDDYLYFDGRNG